MARTVIACYRPKSGDDPEIAARLRGLVSEHHGVLRSQGLVTERQPFVMQAKNGVVIEVFEWCSPEAIESAHTNPVVQELWSRFGELCEYPPVGDLEEAAQPFSEFASLSVL